MMILANRLLTGKWFLAVLGPIALIGTLTSCSSEPDTINLFDNYFYRLANALDVEQPAQINQSVFREISPFPKRRDLAYQLSEEKINLLEFLRLSSCDLQRHIGERNSSLGHIMEVSQRLLYEYRFIQLAESCLKQLSQGSTLRSVLQEVLIKKQKDLIKVQWNAVFASPEMQKVFSQSGSPLSIEMLSRNPNELISALETLNDFTQAYAANSERVETAYAVLASSHYLGQLRLTIAMATTYLKVGDTLLQQRLGDRPLCFQQRTNPKFEVLNRVFLKFYIGEVQPFIAQLYQRTQVLFSEIDTLQASLQPTLAFQNYWDKVYKGNTSEWNDFNQAIAQHTKNWQLLLSQCGRLPQ